MSHPQPNPAYWRWAVYEDVRPYSGAASHASDDAPQPQSSASLRHRNTGSATTASTRPKANSAATSTRSYTMHVRESLLTPLSLGSRASAEEEAALPAVVLVHGMVVSGTYLASCGACLAPYMRVYIPDLPGYGRNASTLIDPADCLSIPEQVDVLVAWMERAGLIRLRESQPGEKPPPPPPFLIGNSMGCSLIVELARRYPQCVRGAVLQGPVQDAARAGVWWQLAQFMANGRNEPQSQVLQVWRDWNIAGLRRLYATFQAMRAFKLEPTLRETRAPMLLLDGELDTVSPLSWCLHLSRTRPGLSVAAMLDAPHTTVTTAPKATAEVARRYFSNVLAHEHTAANEKSSPASVPPPRLTSEFALSMANVHSFISEALPQVVLPTFVVGLLAMKIGGLQATLARFVLLFMLLLTVAVYWRVRHRQWVLGQRDKHGVALWSQLLTPPPVPGVADFDSATGFLRAHALALRGHDVPFLGRVTFPGYQVVPWLLNHLPNRIRILAYAILGAAEATPAPILARTLDGTAVARAVLAHYPLDMQYPAVALGSSSGALLHLYHTLQVPWLPNTLMFGVARPSPARKRPRFPGLSAAKDKLVFDLSAELEWGRSSGAKALERNPLWQLHHMADPCQDNLMVAWMSYFRLKQRVLLPEYRDFLLRHLRPGGTILLSDCKIQWPCVKVKSDTADSGAHYFQMGAYGGMKPEQYLRKDAIVDAFVRREVLKQDELEIHRAQQAGEQLHWNAPVHDVSEAHWAPEAEWGLPESFRRDVEEFAQKHGFRVLVLEHDDPQHTAAPVADLLRDWQQDGRREALLKGLTFTDLPPQKTTATPLRTDTQVLYLSRGRDAQARANLLARPSVPSRLSLNQQHLFVSQFVLVEPWWTARTGSVPFWTVFATRDCLKAFECYLEDQVPPPASEKGAGGTAASPSSQTPSDLPVTQSVRGLETKKQRAEVEMQSTQFRSASAALFPHGVRSVGFADVQSWLALLRNPRLFTHPQQCGSGDSEPSLRLGGAALVGMGEKLYPRDFQSMLHFHQQAHLLTQQRYAMASRQEQAMALVHATRKLQAWTQTEG
jgi:pimeloyl-ACP methyl ester carboxylesterase